jgi:hypothetical protein
MTLTTSAKSSSFSHREGVPRKIVPKKAVTFACKFDAPCQDPLPTAALMRYVSDEGLQSANCRRKYMRRGSRSPNMLLLSFDQKQSLQNDECLPGEPAASSPSNSFKKRRLSLVTALRLQLESASILDLELASQRRMSPRSPVSMEQQRNLSSFDLLSLQRIE